MKNKQELTEEQKAEIVAGIIRGTYERCPSCDEFGRVTGRLWSGNLLISTHVDCPSKCNSFNYRTDIIKLEN